MVSQALIPVTDPDLVAALNGAAAAPANAAPPAPAPDAGSPAITAPDAARAAVSDPVTLANLNGDPSRPLGPAGNPDALLKHPMPNAVGALLRGVRDPIDGGAQLLARGLAAISKGSGLEDWANGQVKSTEDANAAGERDYNETQWANRPPSFDVGRAAGNVVATLPLMEAAPELSAAAPVAARILTGAAMGAANNALQPVDPAAAENFWSEKRKQAIFGAVTGGATSAAGEALARVISPNTSAAVQTLLDNGVQPTPGQILGKTAGRLEQGATSVPMVGDSILGAQRGVVEQFNRGAINKALAPIGETLDAGTPLGREAITEMGDKISAAYDKLVPTLAVKADSQFATDAAKLVSNAQFMPPDRVAQFNKVLDGQILSKFSPNGTMTGETFKEVESTLGQLASSYRNSPVADERQLGGAFLELQAQLRSLLLRSNPDKAAELKAVNLAYAQGLRVQGAASGIGAGEGVFTPAQLLSSTRALDPTLRKSAFSRGGALMQDYAEAGKTVMGSKVPDSGTAFRGFLPAMAALGAAGTVSPLYAGALAGGGAATMAAYSRPMQNVIAHILAVRPDGAQAIANAVRGGAPSASAAAPGLLSRLLQ